MGYSNRAGGQEGAHNQSDTDLRPLEPLGTALGLRLQWCRSAVRPRGSA